MQPKNDLPLGIPSIKRFGINLVIAIYLLVLVQGCDWIASDAVRSGRGALVSSTQVSRLDKVEVTETLSSIGGIGIFGVEAYTTVYETITPDGQTAEASGLVLIPRNGFKNAPILVYSHGTISRNEEAPSQSNFDYQLLHYYATTGYVVVAPDLHGFGESTVDFHPYVHAKSTADVSIDMIRAARHLADAVGVSTNNHVYLTGYSQGGYSAMAIHKELEAKYPAEFSVIASTPMAGPYSMSGVMTDLMLSRAVHPNPYYLAFLIHGYNQIYHVGQTTRDLFRPMYAGVPAMLNGQFSGGQINRALPRIPLDMLTEKLINDFLASPESHPLRLALRENDLIDWTPNAPMRLFHCAADDNVPVENSLVATAAFQHRGADVTYVDPNPLANHTGCAGLALFQGKTWLDSFLLSEE